MAQLPDDPGLAAFVNAVVLGSVAAWIFIITRWRQHGEVLPYEPRRPVRWGPIAAILAVALVIMAVLTPLIAVPAREAAANKEGDPAEIAVQIRAVITSQLALVGVFFAAIAVFYRATWQDVGLPRSLAQAGHDVVIGAITCLAALLPVHTVQVALIYLSGRQDDPSGHPLVEMVTSGREPSVLLLALAGVAAVVIAPLCEEVTFRLLLQGWLEKWEDERLGLRAANDVSVGELYAAEGLTEVQTDAALWAHDEAMQGGTEADSADFLSDPAQSPPVLPEPPSRGLFGLPYGWLPILTSSLLFGLAHFGYGPEPIPLFLLALFLGYVYQRTHRIVPCMVAHALFNLFTVVILWRMVFHGE